MDGDEFAGELTPLRPPVPPKRWGARTVAAIRTGAFAGLLPAAAVFTIYFLTHADWDLPWLRLASILAVFAPATTIALTALVELLVAATDRIAGWWRPLVVIANPIVASGLAGALAGIAPGAIGVTVFGSYSGPFVGTALIACGIVASAVMVAVPVARRARRGDDRLAIAGATLIATLILCGAAAVVTPLLVDSSFDQIRGALEEYGPPVGGAMGAIAGAIVGIYIGIVIAVGRVLRR
jgi:hypothetical protein